MKQKSTDCDDFFHDKRQWSLLKDQILQNYLPPYLKKVKNLRKHILILDGFAGPGVFEDNTEGSPIQICKIADEFVPNQFSAVLVNKEKSHHDQLTKHLDKYIKKGVARTLNATAEEALSQMHEEVKDETLFIYLDQFGISGFDYNSILPFLCRDKKYSTELLLNINVNAIHRLSGKKHKDEETKPVLGKRGSLTEALGGEYWKKYLFDDTLQPDEQIFKLMAHYKSMLAKNIEYVGYCPVYEKGPGSTLKYFLFFVSRHVDTVKLLNNIMFKAFYKHIWKCNYADTLFADVGVEITLPSNYLKCLRENILTYLKDGEIGREKLWEKIIIADFMKFHSTDYLAVVKDLIAKKVIGFIDVKKTGKLNEFSTLYMN
jgi:three-Cys-motif partner protein